MYLFIYLSCELATSKLCSLTFRHLRQRCADTDILASTWTHLWNQSISVHVHDCNNYTLWWRPTWQKLQVGLNIIAGEMQEKQNVWFQWKWQLTIGVHRMCAIHDFCESCRPHLHSQVNVSLCPWTLNTQKKLADPSASAFTHLWSARPGAGIPLRTVCWPPPS